ncbi:MAG: Lrp/AsnC family transcriptional regulator [Rhodospirillaceae bacterium]|nr:Lrp/AsnC family transcriptional regulator [Rhodospirillaceae bacterium]MBL6940563.1 AsnC family protein [Rhodospirillales bacterium]
MELSDHEKRLVAALGDGLPLVSRPFAVIAEQVGISEADVIETLSAMQADGRIKRFGLIVRHHELGYRANAMTVWDVADDKVAQVGRCFGEFDFVTLCYRRPRRLPDWPYNLFCMVHGQKRDDVLEQVEQLARTCGADAAARDVLFSTRRFKQRGAHYGASPKKLESVA